MAQIRLPKDLEAWVRDQVAAGRAESADSLVERALRELQHLTDGHRALVEQAYSSVARGDVIDEADADAQLDQWIADDLAAVR